MSNVVTFNGQSYTLITDADISGCLLPYPKNYHEVDDGEEFDFEMSARATGEDGNIYKIIWIFSTIKGEECKYDDFDYSSCNIHSVNLL